MIIITGASGNIGKRLCAYFPNTYGIDLVSPADLIGDLATLDYHASPLAEKFASAAALIHLATSADPEAHDDVHFTAAANTARLVSACAFHNIPRLILVSSNWAEPSNGQALNAYGYSKRIFEDLAKMYNLTPERSAKALRIGWVPSDKRDLIGAQDYLLQDHWDDEKLITAFTTALAH